MKCCCWYVAGWVNASQVLRNQETRIVALRYILEVTVGRAVEVSKHDCLSRGLYRAHAAENWCGDTPGRVTTRIEVGGIAHVRLSRRDGWDQCRYGKS